MFETASLTFSNLCQIITEPTQAIRAEHARLSTRKSTWQHRHFLIVLFTTNLTYYEAPDSKIHCEQPEVKDCVEWGQIAIQVSVLQYYHPLSSRQLLEMHLNRSLAHLPTKCLSCLNTSLPPASTMQACGAVKKELLSFFKGFAAFFKIRWSVYYKGKNVNQEWCANHWHSRAAIQKGLPIP